MFAAVDTRNTIISAESAAKLPNKTALLAESNGNEAVISLEVFHQLHCLVCQDSKHRLQNTKIESRTLFDKLYIPKGIQIIVLHLPMGHEIQNACATMVCLYLLIPGRTNLLTGF
jgi:hypothetical protein